jgi:hypothetical protein
MQNCILGDEFDAFVKKDLCGRNNIAGDLFYRNAETQPEQSELYRVYITTRVFEGCAKIPMQQSITSSDND